MVYFVMALALFADDDYEEVAARLTETLRSWDCWDAGWEVPGQRRDHPGQSGSSCGSSWRARSTRRGVRVGEQVAGRCFRR